MTPSFSFWAAAISASVNRFSRPSFFNRAARFATIQPMKESISEATGANTSVRLLPSTPMMPSFQTGAPYLIRLSICVPRLVVMRA